MAITKYVLPVVVGAMAGMILISFGEMGIHYIYPLPAGLSFRDKAALATVMMQLPVTVFVLLLVNYAFSSFIAGCICSLIAGRNTPIPAIVVGIALTMAGLFNLFTIPQPIWFCILSLIIYLPFTCLGYLIARSTKI